MNAYFVDAGEHDYVAEWIAGYPRYETERFVDIVFAPSRGRAKSLFAMRHPDIKYTGIKSVRLIARDVGQSEGFARPDDELWLECDKVIDELAKALIWESWTAEAQKAWQRHQAESRELDGRTWDEVPRV